MAITYYGNEFSVWELYLYLLYLQQVALLIGEGLHPITGWFVLLLQVLMICVCFECYGSGPSLIWSICFGPFVILVFNLHLRRIQRETTTMQAECTTGHASAWRFYPRGLFILQLCGFSFNRPEILHVCRRWNSHNHNSTHPLLLKLHILKAMMSHA